jgi:hypothetical protein
MSTELTWHLPDGTILDRVHVHDSTWERRGASLVMHSRKDFTCILGCKIPAGSRYVRLEMMAGNGRMDSHVALALCPKHLDDFAGGDAKSWLAIMSSEELLNCIRKQDNV